MGDLDNGGPHETLPSHPDWFNSAWRSNPPGTGGSGIANNAAETRQAFAAPVFFRGSAKCLRNPHCRKAVAERAKKLRDRLDKWINEFTFGALQQLHDLLGEAIGAKDNSEAIARLDRLEQLVEQNGLLSADVRQEIEELRSALWP